ncbi:hypothetical protein [Botrimarina sp.]|uniref:hypothetical protein n=1 Tax=Botrimarina sp. TaxID=2795802 RepID=UPI0032EAE531
MPTRLLHTLAVAVWFSALATATNGQVVLFSENFDGVPLGPAVDENVVVTEFWSNSTASLPGWSIDNSQLPGGGTTEWRGWSFTDPDLWATTDLQNRGQFQKGENVIAVADPDEWDDITNDPGLYNTFLRTAAFDVSGATESTLALQFDSSWRPEGRDEDPDGPGPLPQGANNQTAVIRVAYDGGPFQTEVLRWDSDSSSPFFKPDATNETPTVDIPLPAGTSSLALEFGLIDAGNDWWWAIDNLGVFDGDPTLAMVINRDTGVATLENNTNADVAIRGYTIESGAGTLDRAAFTPIADSDPNWVEFRGDAPGSVVGEGHLTAGQIDDGASIDLGPVWRKYLLESDDLAFSYLDANGEIVEGVVRFTGNSGEPFRRGDLNFDGEVDALDWPAVRDNFGGDLSGLSVYEAYRLGDLTGDRVNNLDDFLIFKDIFIAEQGAPAYANLIAGVPEPGSLAVMLTAAAVAGSAKWRPRRSPAA